MITRKQSPQWRTEVESLPAADLRLARYSLQLLDGAPELKRRLHDPDFLGALWQLLQPVMHPRAVLSFVTPPDDGDEDDLRSDWDDESIQPLDDRHLRERLRRCFASIPRAVVKRVAKADAAATLSPTVALLDEQLALDGPTLQVLDFLDQHILSEPLRTLLRECQPTPARINLPRLAALIGLSPKTLRETLSRGAPLRALGLVSYEDDHSDLEDFLHPSDLLRGVLDAAPADGEALLRMLIEPAPAQAWPLADFPHLARESAHLSEVLGEAARSAVVGVNALLHGDPGTGKTELARAVAAASGLKAYQVRSAGEDAGGLDREGRLSAYLLAQRLLARRRDALLIFDEVEDVFESDHSLLALLRGGSAIGRQKGWMNRILEENAVPAIWISNRTDGMDPAFLRRFLLPVPFVTPPRSVRRQMAERHLGGAGLAPDLLDELAADPMLAPAQLGAARRLLDLRPGTAPEQTVREGVAALRALLHGAPAPRRRSSATDFDVAYLNLSGGFAPSALVQALRREGRGSLCFFGPPGTGKTAFAEVLAEALDLELIAQRASDLLSPYVGETEQRLAQLFRDCDPRHTLLMLDEVDSFLSDRRQAQRLWERTQVNELLQQMEHWPGIFIAATNLMAGTDQAALRRFDFKIGFRTMTAAQRVALFAREALGDAQAPVPPLLVRHLERREGLTPGDFATVCRQQRLLGEPFTPEQFLKRLVVEWQLKADVSTQVACA
ncbi:ATP-binding protein [Thiorhodococcus mannitoliphagus]|uniref:ATP-binding protein n=1 Tax=Thiorhodococcus mannitoliphagus TaxID=329406 RepID=A0A6P1DZ71_9GAMM|nr:ATP-binding protein [Thiorhodococcus mannitoliphagus]NEX22780.1 ATP-binding protein [Thiorhodococcus mannitoliphagus]